MADPVFDSAGSVTDGGGGATTTATAVAAGAGTNRILVVYPTVGSGGPAAPTGVTYNGVALTHLASASITRSFFNADGWYMLESSLPGAAANIVATYAGGHDEKAMAWEFWHTVEQSGPWRGAAATTANANSTTASVTVPSGAGERATGVMWTGTAAGITASAGTPRVELDSVLGFEGLGVSDVVGTSPTLTWAIGSAADWVMSAGSLIGAAGGGAPATQETQNSARRNKPGRGPYSLGRYFRPGIDAYTSPQISRSAAASLSAAVQAAQAATTGIGLAVQQAGAVTAALDLAAQQARSATASLQLAAQTSGQSTASLDAALQLARSATATLDLAVQQALSQVANISALVQGQTSATASIDLQVQAGSSASLALQVTVQEARALTASIDAALQVARTAAADLSLAAQLARVATASLDLQVQAGTSVATSIGAAVQTAGSLAASVQAAVQAARAMNADLGLAVVLQLTAFASLQVLVRGERTAAVGLSLYVNDPFSGVIPTWPGGGPTRIGSTSLEQPTRRIG